jgi:hypothetical protein
MKTYFLALAFVLIALPSLAAIDHVYLVMPGDGSTAMTVQFHSESAIDSVVHYGLKSLDSDAQSEFTATGKSHQIPGLPDGRYVHAVELTGLTPATTYYFKASNGKSGQFRTLPADGSPIRAVFGGDMSVFPLETQMLKVAAKEAPDVAVLGGDIAYANGDLKNIKMWDMWLQRWEDFMVRADGGMIPMIMAIGNHEVNDSEDPDPTKRAPFYFGFFSQGGQSYFTRELGAHARVIALDSGHITAHAEQVPFLREALDGTEKPFVFTTYHVPLFPSHRDFDDSRSVAGREHWQPLFDEFDLSIGWEHHDHTFKRSKPIRGAAVDPEGTVYMGDGSMGVAVREINNGDAWYMEKAESKAHVWVADITAEKVHCRAVDQLGVQFDEVTIAPRAVPVAP